MSAQPDRHLHPVEDAPAANLVVVNGDTGERLGALADHVQPLEDAVAGLQRDIRGWAARYADLKRDKDGEAKESPVWPVAKKVFDYWRRTCKHPRSAFTLDRFELIRPFLEKLGDKDKPPAERLAEAEALCKRAIDGAAHDPFITRRKNGTPKRHDGIDLIFRNADKMEEFCNRAPINRSSASADAGEQPQSQQKLDRS